MKKNEFFQIIRKLRKNISSPYIYANYFFDYNNSDYIYSKYFKNKISLLSYLKVFLLIFVNIILIIGVIIIKSKKSHEKFNYKNSKIIIIGHRINEKSRSDFYFFELIKYFKSKSIRFNLYQINHIKSKSNNPFLINSYMSLKNEIKLLFRIISSLLSVISILKKNIKLKNNKIYFYFIIISCFLSNKSLNNIRIPEQIYNIFKFEKKNTKIFVTYEGYHWEKVLFGLLQNSNNFNNNYIYALQHSYIAINNKNFFDFSNKLFNPDFLLTSGLIMHDKVKLLFKNTINLGSTKKNEKKNIINKFKNSNYIIFLPSSNKRELNYLLNLLLYMYDNFPSYKYIWRSHPFMNSDIKKISKKYPFIEFSNNELHYDFKRSKLAFYSISSSIIKAVCYGVRPVYVKNSFIDVDPLEELSNPWKVKIQNYKSVNKILNYDNNKELFKYMIFSSIYCNKYFERFKISKIKKLINE